MFPNVDNSICFDSSGRDWASTSGQKHSTLNPFQPNFIPFRHITSVKFIQRPNVPGGVSMLRTTYYRPWDSTLYIFSGLITASFKDYDRTALRVNNASNARIMRDGSSLPASTVLQCFIHTSYFPLICFYLVRRQHSFRATCKWD